MSISIDKKTVKDMLDFPTKSEPNPFLKYKIKIKEDTPKKKKIKLQLKKEIFFQEIIKFQKKMKMLK